MELSSLDDNWRGEDVVWIAWDKGDGSEWRDGMDWEERM